MKERHLGVPCPGNDRIHFLPKGNRHHLEVMRQGELEVELSGQETIPAKHTSNVNQSNIGDDIDEDG